MATKKNTVLKKNFVKINVFCSTHMIRLKAEIFPKISVDPKFLNKSSSNNDSNR